MNNGEKIRKFGKKIREMKVDWWLGGDKWVLVIHSGLPIPICHILVPNPLSFHEFFHRFLQDQWKFVIMLAISKNEYNDDYWEAIKISGLSWLMGKLNRQVAVLSAAELAELAFINQVQSERSDLCTIGLKYACTKITKIIVVFSSAYSSARFFFSARHYVTITKTRHFSSYFNFMVLFSVCYGKWKSDLRLERPWTLDKRTKKAATRLEGRSDFFFIH